MGPLGLPELIIIAIIFLVPLGAAVGIVMLVLKLARRNAAQATAARRCPFCSAISEAEANVCRGCGRDLGVPAPNQPR